MNTYEKVLYSKLKNQLEEYSDNIEIDYEYDSYQELEFTVKSRIHSAVIFTTKNIYCLEAFITGYNTKELLG